MYSELKALYILYEIKIKPTIYKSDPHLCKYSNRDTLNGRGTTVKIGTRRPKAAQELARQECDRDEKTELQAYKHTFTHGNIRIRHICCMASTTTENLCFMLQMYAMRRLQSERLVFCDRRSRIAIARDEMFSSQK